MLSSMLFNLPGRTSPRGSAIRAAAPRADPEQAGVVPHAGGAADGLIASNPMRGISLRRAGSSALGGSSEQRLSSPFDPRKYSFETRESKEQTIMAEAIRAAARNGHESCCPRIEDLWDEEEHMLDEDLKDAVSEPIVNDDWYKDDIGSCENVMDTINRMRLSVAAAVTTTPPSLLPLGELIKALTGLAEFLRSRATFEDSNLRSVKFDEYDLSVVSPPFSCVVQSQAQRITHSARPAVRSVRQVEALLNHMINVRNAAVLVKKDSESQKRLRRLVFEDSRHRIHPLILEAASGCMPGPMLPYHVEFSNRLASAIRFHLRMLLNEQSGTHGLAPVELVYPPTKARRISLQDLRGLFSTKRVIKVDAMGMTDVAATLHLCLARVAQFQRARRTIDSSSVDLSGGKFDYAPYSSSPIVFDLPEEEGSYQGNLENVDPGSIGALLHGYRGSVRLSAQLIVACDRLARFDLKRRDTWSSAKKWARVAQTAKCVHLTPLALLADTESLLNLRVQVEADEAEEQLALVRSPRMSKAVTTFAKHMVRIGSFGSMTSLGSLGDLNDISASGEGSRGTYSERLSLNATRKLEIFPKVKFCMDHDRFMP